MIRGKRLISKETLLHDAYYGTGLFENGKGLKQHPRESLENFMSRQDLAYYLNYTGPIVDANVNPIFKDAILREYNDTEMFQAFLEDCDGSGTTYQDFCKSAALQAKIYGIAYVVVDNAADQDSSKEAALKNRHFPFLKLVLPSQVKNWLIDNHGIFSKFEYMETMQVSASGQHTTRHVWTRNEWQIGEGGEMIAGAHGLGRVPVVPWYSRNTKKTEVKPASEYISVAQANYFLYQLCSWHTQLLRDQAFSILTLPDTGADELTVGTNNVMTYPPESSHPPAFISPDAGPAAMLTDQMDRIIKEMFRMSGLDSVVGVRADASKSGVAKQWEFEKTNQKLADFSVRCEAADREIIELYSAWSGENVQYYCEYPRDFKINDVADALAAAQAALDLNFDSATYKQEVLKKVLTAYLPNIEPEIYDKIVEEVAQGIQDAKMEGAFANKGIGDTDGDDGNG